MVDAVVPSVNPAGADELPDALLMILSKYIKSSVDDMLPAEVVSFDPVLNIAVVKPLIMMLDTAGNLIPRGQLQVPVFTMGSGDAMVRFKIRPKSLGWIKSNDRDISLFLQDKVESAPNTFRAHKFSDAVFFPDFLRDFTISGDDADALMVIQNTAGTVRFSLFEEKIVMTAPGIEMVGSVAVTGTVSATGDISTEAGITAASDISSDTEVTAGAVNLTSHTHQYVNTLPNGSPSPVTTTSAGTG